MTPGNFNWLLHTMLFLQTQHVLKKQDDKASAADDDENSNDSEVDVVVNV